MKHKKQMRKVLEEKSSGVRINNSTSDKLGKMFTKFMSVQMRLIKREFFIPTGLITKTWLNLDPVTVTI